MKFLRSPVYIGLSAIILLTPAVLNCSPFLFYDTLHYLEFGRSIAVRLPLFRNLAETEAPTSSQDTPSTTVISKDSARDHPSLSYAGGRSPYYSFFTYVLIKLGGLWAVICVQALLAASLLWIAHRLITPSASANQFLLTTLVLAGLSSLSFYADMIMPDVFAGLALLALGLLALGFDRLSNWTRIGLVALIAGAASTHVTIPVVCVTGIVCLAVTQLFLHGRSALKRWAVLVWATVALSLAGFSSALFTVASKVILGAPPQSPPYLMARVLADGTGRTYLRESCHPFPKYYLCSFEDRNFRTQDDFLWDADPGIGVFSVSDYKTRKKLKEEELSFVLGAIMHHPLWQAQVSTKHWLRQLGTFGLSEFQGAKRSWDSMAFDTVIPEQEALYKSSLAYQGYFPFTTFAWLQAIGVIVSIVWLIFRLTRRDIRAALRRAADYKSNVEELLVTSGIALSTALLVNAASCGIFSGVNDRYEARLIWLVPTLAILVLGRMGFREKELVAH
jgi:hypothetical protein